MSPSIDSRIVDMQFNNKQFESGIKSSLNSLNNLKKGLDFKESTRNLSNLNDAAKKFSLAGIAEGVETIANRFTNLGIIGVTALQNITNRAVDMAVALGKSLTIDQVTAGWGKYEQKTASIQTIMNSTGKSIDEVNRYLDKLMWFADETSYGFSDMTAALAQMTSTGGDIDKLIPMITGVANSVAYAGKGATEFSRAMYNLNQSYGSGHLQYMDWRSLELAGVASKELKQIFIDTAVELGKIKKGAVTIGDFGSTLKKGWADTTVMEAAFGKFSELSDEAYRLVQAGKYDTAAEAIEALAGKYSEVAEKAFKSAQSAKTFTEAIDATKDAVSSGWMKTFEIIFGNLEEGTKLWTEFTNTLWETFAAGAEGRNEMLQAWKDAGGRDDLIDSFKNVYHALMAIVTPIKEAFREVFPPMTTERLLAMTKALKEFTARLKIGEGTAEKVKNIFHGLFSVLSILKGLFLVLARAAKELAIYLAPLGKKLFDFANSIGLWLVNADGAINKADAFNKAFEKVKEVITQVAARVKKALGDMKVAIEGFTGLDLSSLGTFIASIREKFKPLEMLGVLAHKAVELFKKAYDKVAPYLAAVAKKIGDAFSKMDFDKFVKLFTTGSFSAVLLGITSLSLALKGVGESTSGFLGSITNAVAGLSNIFRNAGDLVGKLSGILDGVKNSLNSFSGELKARALLKVALAIGVLSGALLLLSMVDASKLGGAIAAITVLFADLMGSMIAFEKATKDAAFGSILKITTGMVILSVAMLILSKAVHNLAQSEWAEVAKGVLAVGVLMAMMVGMVKILSKSTGGIIKTSIGLMILAVAVRLFATSVAALGKIETENLIKGILGLLSVLAMLAGFMAVSKYSGLGPSDAAALLLVAVAVRVIASAIKSLSKIDTSALTTALFAMGILLLELAIFTQIMGNGKGMIATGVGMIFLATALLIFTAAIKLLGNTPIDVLVKGLAALAVTLALIAAAVYIMPPTLPLIGLGLVGVAVGLLIMAAALKIMGSMTWDELARGLVALAGSLIIIAVATNAMTTAIVGAAAMLVVSAALLALSVAMKILGSMSLAAIAKSILTIVAVFVVLGAMGVVLAPVIPMMFALSAVMLLLGVGLIAVGVASVILGFGLNMLSAAGFQGVKVMLSLVAAMLPLTLMSPAILVLGAALVVLSVGIFLVGASLMMMAVGLGMLVALGPAGNEALIELTNTAVVIASWTVELLAAGIALVLFGAGAIVAGVGAVAAGIGLIIFAAGIKEFAKADLTNMESLGKLGEDLLSASLSLLLASPGLLAAGAALYVFGNGARATGEGLDRINTGMLKVVDTVKDVPDNIKKATKAITESIDKLTDEVSDTLKSHKPQVEKASGELIDSSLTAINDKKGAFETAGTNLAMGFINGIKNKSKNAANVASYMAKSALDAANRTLEIQSPSKAFGDTARYSVLGFVRDFKKYTPLAVAAASNMSVRTLQPVLEMTDNAVLGTDRIAQSLQKVSREAHDMAPSIVTEKNATVHHQFDTLHVEGVNDDGEFVAAADYSIDELVAEMRRQQRV